jgi:hypothetical protein
MKRNMKFTVEFAAGMMFAAWGLFALWLVLYIITAGFR